MKQPNVQFQLCSDKKSKRICVKTQNSGIAMPLSTNSHTILHKDKEHDRDSWEQSELGSDGNLSMWGSDYIFIESPRGLRQSSEGSFCIINERASTHCLLSLCQNKRAGNVHVWVKSWGVQYFSGRFVR